MTQTTKPVFTLRSATPDDCATILRLIRGLAEYEKLLDKVTATSEQLHKTLFGSRAYAETILAEVEENGQKKAVGFALFFHNYSTFLGKPGLYLEDLYVEPEYRSYGIGKGLLSHLAALALERDCGRFEWSVLDWNIPSIEFYKAMGAVMMDEWRICRVTGESLQKLATLKRSGMS